MCGFVGFINCGSKHQLKDAISTITHRGPDDEGLQWFNNANTGLAHRRLSIIDLSPLGHQPMTDTSGKYHIAFNGEVYNYLDIRKELEACGVQFKSHTDTEVVLEAFVKWGIDSLQKLNGMFAFVVYNTETDETFAVRDRLGIKPLYYTQTDNGLVLASEIKAILASGLYQKEPDHFSLHTLVHYQTAPYTGFKNLLKLEPGTCIHFSKGKLLTEKYWQINTNQQDISYDAAFEQLDYLLNDSVKLQMTADVPVGLLLSGGLDSSIIGALMKKQTNHPVHSFTIKFKAEDLKKQGNVDDSYYAAKLAEQFGFNHSEILIEPNVVDLLPKMIWHLDEPLADPAAINTYLICQAARDRGVYVLLNGMGGDEVFSGYRAHLACLKAESFQKKIPGFARKSLAAFIGILPEATKGRNLKYVRWLKSFMAIANLPPFERALAVKNSALTSKNFEQYYSNAPISFKQSHHFQTEKALFESYHTDYLTQMCINDTRIYMADHNLTYTDKASMAASVECRPPLIDHRIVEFMFKLKPGFRINNGVQKYLLKKVSEKYVPNEIIYRPKAPFSAPMRGWLKNELAEMVNDVLAPSALNQRGVYNSKYVSKLIDQNRKGLADHSQLIFRLLVNQLWYSTFFKS